MTISSQQNLTEAKFMNLMDAYDRPIQHKATY